jgi:hypothetical protein
MIVKITMPRSSNELSQSGHRVIDAPPGNFRIDAAFCVEQGISHHSHPPFLTVTQVRITAPS